MVAKVIHSLKIRFENWWGILLALIAGILVAKGYFSPRNETDSFTIMIVSVIFLFTTWKILGRFKTDSKISNESNLSEELELLFIFVIALSVFIQFTGGYSSKFYPLTFALAAFLGAFYQPIVSIPAFLLQVGIEFLSSNYSSGYTTNSGALLNSGLLFVFYILGYSSFRIEKYNLRRRFTRNFKNELNKLKQDARDFRIIGTSISTNRRNREENEQLLAVAGVETIKENLYFLINLLGETMGMTTVVLLWLDPSGKKFSIKEASTQSDYMSSQNFDSLSGSIGNIVRTQQPLILGNFQERFSKGSLPYYHGPEDVGSFIGVPVFENNQLRGILCGDRRDTTPFSREHLRLFRNASEQVIRILTTEQTFQNVEKSKFEQEKFFQASTMLNNALELNEVIESAFSAANSIIPHEEDSLILKDEKTDKLILLGSKGKLFGNTGQVEIESGRSLLTIAMENKHYMPINGRLRDKKQIIIPGNYDFSKVGSIIIIPLITGENVIGAFILADSKRDLFTRNRREMLGVIANQIAVTLQNSLMYQKLETMATTDGLTNLYNHRTFQEKFDEMLSRAQRINSELSVIIVDIDKFKSVNDTYGHPIGDVVIKRVASILKQKVRTIDLAARYGGEEFALLLEGTPKDGAKILAERIRQEVESQVYDSPLGQFRCSISMGISTFPTEGTHKQELIDKSDKSLYYAKEHGRNQVVHYSDVY